VVRSYLLDTIVFRSHADKAGIDSTIIPDTVGSTQKQALKELCHGQKCLHLSSESEAYHEQMDTKPSSNGSLDIALFSAHTQTADITELAAR